MTEPLLEIDALSIAYRKGDAWVEAVNDITFQVGPGETLGIVGESGCGKSTLGMALIRLLPANAEVRSGRVLYAGNNVLDLDDERMRTLRGTDVSMVFQDPLTSLNPTISIRKQMVDIQRAHDGRNAGRQKLVKRAVEMLTRVGIPDASDRIDGFPHQFSGGMRQRVMIAMALLMQPSVLIADETTTALDVTLQAQILRLLKDLCAENGTAVVFISHDLGAVAQVSDRVLVMYAGRAVEEADVHSLFDRPLHPYTQGLLASIPTRRRRGQRLAGIPGRVPSLADLPAGCKFADRCGHVQEVNRLSEPRYVDLAGHRVRCNLYDPESGYPGARAEPQPPKPIERQV